MEREVKMNTVRSASSRQPGGGSGRRRVPAEPPRRTSRPAEDKKQQRRKKRRRHGSPILLYIMLILIVLGISAVLCCTVFFGAEAVEVKGESIYSAEEIIAASSLEVGDNIFSTSIKNIPDKMTQTLPFLKSAEISRNLFPPKFIISVEAAYAKYITEDQTTLLDDNLKVLQTSVPADMDKSGLTEIKGAPLSSPQSGQAAVFEDEDAKDTLNSIIKAIALREINGVTKIDISDPMKILLTYEDRVLIVVGSTAELDYKMQYAKRMLEQEISASQEGKLDLSWLVSGKSTVYFSQGSIEIFEAELSGEKTQKD